MFLCVYLKIEFMSISILISLRMRESDKMSAESAHVQETSEGESPNAPVLSSPYSLTIYAEYVFIYIF